MGNLKWRYVVCGNCVEIWATVFKDWQCGVAVCGMMPAAAPGVKEQRCGVLRARPLTPCVDKGTPVAASGSQGAVVEDEVLEVIDQLDAAIICRGCEGEEV